MLEIGSDPNYQDTSKRTALHHALNVTNTDANASFEIEKALLRYKA